MPSKENVLPYTTEEIHSEIKILILILTFL